MGTIVELREINKAFTDKNTGTSRTILKDVSLTLDRGNIVALMGANGSGKTSLLRILGGLDTPDSGETTPHGPGTSLTVDLLFQDFRATLLPWFSIRRNITFPLRHSRRGASTDAAVFLDKIMPGLDLDRLPTRLSGGEAQAVTLARALAREVDLLLLDEPFSSLDLAARLRAIEVCKSVFDSGRCGAAVMVTHSLADAAALAHRVLVLKSHPGQISADISLADIRDRETPEGFSVAVKLLKEKVEENIAAD